MNTEVEGHYNQLFSPEISFTSISQDKLCQILFPATFHNKMKSLDLSREDMRRLRLRHMCNDGTFCWLNDKVYVITL